VTDRRWRDAVVATIRSLRRGVAGPAGEARWSQLGGQGGVSIWRLEIGPARFFVKVGTPGQQAMLSAEAEGLRTIGQAGAVRVPGIAAAGIAEGAAFLALEWLDIVDGGRDAALGRALAALHRVHAPQFGWHRDNTIGLSPQSNGWHDDWSAFYRDRRLAPQLEMALRAGHRGRLAKDGDRLLAAVPQLLDGHRPAPALLHGDLWAGNAARLADGTPVLFDPSCYHGDREADLAMTELFGGFSSDFYAAYLESAPLPAGFERRRTLYNLYHVLNHLNMFGAGYLARAEAMV
jgi:fructosamine-3-kinase